MARKWDDFDMWDEPRRTRGRSRMRGAGIGLVLFGLGVIAGGFVLDVIQSANGRRPIVVQLGKGPLQSGGALPTNSNLISQIYKSANPSVVTITAVSTGTDKSGNSGQEDIGTGFLIDNNGDIATNNHVVSGQKTVSVTVGDNTVQGTVLGTDPMDDLAIIHITPPAGLPPLQLGTAKSVQPGNLVVAIGNPFQLTGSVSTGIISGLNRSMPTQSGRVMSGLIQTDAALNPGNSGGPLLDEYGQVIGINTAIESPVQGFVGIGFAIPIDRLVQLLPNLLHGDRIDHPWLGISGEDIDPYVQQSLHLPASKGVLVITTVKDGPAAKAGIRGDSGGKNNVVGDGDIITAVNGQPVKDIAELTGAISSYAVGDVIHLSILRQGKPMQLDVTLGPWPSNTSG